MKIFIPPSQVLAKAKDRARVHSGRSGFMLMEAVVYIAVFLLLTGVATTAFYECWDSSKAVVRDTDDIARSLRVGEQWRADIRAGRGPVQSVVQDAAQILRIPTASGDVVYTLTGSELRRAGGGPAAESVVLSRVQSTSMQSEPLGAATIWRWELELASKRTPVRVRPLFTFSAVSTQGTAHAP
jgi:hypothetical protein